MSQVEASPFFTQVEKIYGAIAKDKHVQQAAGLAIQASPTLQLGAAVVHGGAPIAGKALKSIYDYIVPGEAQKELRAGGIGSSLLGGILGGILFGSAGQTMGAGAICSTRTQQRSISKTKRSQALRWTSSNV